MNSSGVHPFLLGILRGSGPDSLLPVAGPPPDWEGILRDAVAHGITAYLYRCLKRWNALQQLPADLAGRLEGEYFALAARNLLLASELGTILRALAARQIPCAPLRGLGLAESLHGDITIRPMGDLDLLVRRRHLPQVAAILLDLGFREMDRHPGFAWTFSHTLEFHKLRHGWIIVEPHWTLAYPPFADRLDMERVWARSVRGRVIGVETWILPEEELLLHLCLHITHRDGSAPLLWFYEVDRFLRQEGKAIDWSRLLSVARQANLELLLAQPLSQVRTLFQTPIPDQFLDQLTPSRPRSVEGRMARLVDAVSRVDGKESLVLLFTLKGFRAKLQYTLALLFPSAEFMRLACGRNGGSRLGFAYFQRFCRLSWESVKGVLRLLL